jgi:hypothetical protein
LDFQQEIIRILTKEGISLIIPEGEKKKKEAIKVGRKKKEGMYSAQSMKFVLGVLSGLWDGKAREGRAIFPQPPQAQTKIRWATTMSNTPSKVLICSSKAPVDGSHRQTQPGPQ